MNLLSYALKETEALEGERCDEGLPCKGIVYIFPGAEKP